MPTDSGGAGIGILQGSHIFRLGTFLAHGHIHGDLLAFVQRTSASTVDGAEVDENVFAACLLNETETFLVIEPLYGTLYLI